jgi:site-specific DNA-adenine methylase
MQLKRFFSFYGSKWRMTPLYEPPKHKIIVEPFAGSAGYATHYSDREVILIEKDLRIAAMWKFLTSTSYEEIMSLPLMQLDQTITDLEVREEAKTLIGFWINAGCSQPMKTPSQWMRSGESPDSFWGEAIRKRIATQVKAISHWEVIQGDYTDAPNVKATWFVDPPYQKAGKRYKHSASSIDFSKLAQWCVERTGQVIVCENDGADWLPFEPFTTILSSNKRRENNGFTKEVIFKFDSEISQPLLAWEEWQNVVRGQSLR